MIKNHLELLMPAGSLQKLNLAYDYGADAVYLGPPFYSLRARQNPFQLDVLQAAVTEARQRQKQIYFTLNIFSRNRKLKSFAEDVVDYAKLKPDAFIMSDPGLIAMARELAPEIPIHLSVQANCMNWQSAKFWQKSLGIERLILSRELSIQEIAEIKQRVPDLELEAFVHGSICIAYSGRCLLSSYMDHRDANQGVCDNSCREKYKVFEKEVYIQDANQPGTDLYQVDEDENGTYVLNAKDLCMVDHIDKLAEAGVVSFKVEGRTKSEFYVAMVARSYRGALDDLAAGRPIDSYWREELNQLTNRGYHTAFMLGNPSEQGQNYQSSSVFNEKIKFHALTKKDSSEEGLLVDIKNKLIQGQKVKLISPNLKTETVIVDQIISAKGTNLSEVHSGATDVWLKVRGPKTIKQNSLLVTDEA